MADEIFRKSKFKGGIVCNAKFRFGPKLSEYFSNCTQLIRVSRRPIKVSKDNSMSPIEPPTTSSRSVRLKSACSSDQIDFGCSSNIPVTILKVAIIVLPSGETSIFFIKVGLPVDSAIAQAAALTIGHPIRLILFRLYLLYRFL